MTGYGRAKKTLSNRDITVEVRSVNNRYLDCTVKLPRAYIFAEDAIKGRVQKAISRGKVDVFVTIDSTGADEEVVVVNEGLARSYLEALRKLYEIDGGNYLQKAVLRGGPRPHSGRADRHEGGGGPGVRWRGHLRGARRSARVL